MCIDIHSLINQYKAGYSLEKLSSIHNATYRDIILIMHYDMVTKNKEILLSQNTLKELEQ
jgi:hypothetical protein